MKTQDKLFDKIKQAAQNQEQQSFDQKEKVWSAVTDKLNRKKRKTMTLYKSLSAAAVIAIMMGVGFSWFNSSNPTPEPNVVESPIIKDVKIEQDHKKTIVAEDSSFQKSNEISTEPMPRSKTKKLKQPRPKPAVMVAETDEIQENKKDSTPVLTSKDIIVASDEIYNAKDKSKTKSTEVSKVKNSNRETEIAYSAERISGQIFDQDSLPIPGVNVIVKGTNRGTQTDFDGKFSIEAKPKETLIFSYIGFITQEIKIKDQKNITVVLHSDNLQLNEVVVVDKSTRRQRRREKRRQKNTETIQQVPDASISQVMSGKEAEAKLRQANGQPTSVMLRGVTSLRSSEEPLFIVDGKPINSKEFSSINPNKIKSLKVLKDANATSIYGNRGANGVVLLLTDEANFKEKKAFDSIAKTVSIPIQPDNEDYESFKENPFTSPLSEPLSTFSIDVDRAAYTNIRRMINNGQDVPKDAVRIEEMLNFFEYNYDKPKSKHPFAIRTVYSDAPWNDKHKLLKIALQGKDVPLKNLPASNLVFLIDVSGSMNNQNKLPLVKKSLNLLVDQMRNEDKIALVTYAGNSQVVLESTSGDQKPKIKTAINSLSSGGGTYASQGIETAYQLAEENFVEDGNNRVIIATDGDFNIGVTQNKSLEDLIAKKRKTNIFLTCLGYGMGNYKDSKMQSLSQKGNGNYAYIDTYQEAQKFLEREFKGSLYAIAKDVKIQIEFNPKHVDSYRLIGYETRMLEDRDFADDTKDAGEIGVNHQVTALYEVIPRGVESQFGEFKPNLKYQYVETPSFENHSDELATVKFRYKPPKSDKSIKMERIIKNKSIKLDNADADFKFAIAVAWFGLKLRDSQLISKADKEGIINLAKEGLENDKEGYRAEFIRLVNLNE